MINSLLAKFEDIRSPMKTAHKFGVEEIIDPRDTRSLACEVSFFFSFFLRGGVLHAVTDRRLLQWVGHAYDHILPQRLVLRQDRYGLDGKPSAGKGYRL
jgi:hypothetical protein